MNKKQYTSLELSERLYKAGFEKETEYIYVFEYLEKDKWELIKFEDYCIANPCIPAYDLLWDICIKYVKEIFGEKEIARKTDDELLGRDDADNFDNTDFEWIQIVEVTTEILYLLQRGKEQEAEDYIIKHSSLFNK